MQALSFVSHYRLGDDYHRLGEDDICRMALRYLLLNSDGVFVPVLGSNGALVFHLFHGQLIGGSLTEPTNMPPYFWRYAFKVSVTGPGSDDLPFSIPTDLSPDLSAWKNESPSQHSRLQREISGILLPIIVARICTPLIQWLSTEVR